MSRTKIKLFSVTSVNFGFILSVTNLIIQITGIFKTVMNPGIAKIVPAELVSAPYHATKTSCLVVQTLIATSRSVKQIQKIEDLENSNNGSFKSKPSSNLELLVNQFNNAIPENSNDPEKFLQPNIMTLRKCITLKYLTKINHYPYSIQLNVILMEILMTFNIS